MSARNDDARARANARLHIGDSRPGAELSPESAPMLAARELYRAVLDDDGALDAVSAAVQVLLAVAVTELAVDGATAMAGCAHAVAVSCLYQDDPTAKWREFAGMVRHVVEAEMASVRGGHA